LDLATLALVAVDVVIPYIASLGKEAAKSAADETGKSVWQWLKAKLTSEGGKEAVNDLEIAPNDADNRKAAEAALSKFLKTDPSALVELSQLLEKAGVATMTVTTNVVGNENMVGQVVGSGTVSINRVPTPGFRPDKRKLT
jgi:hypothetical protein